MALHAEGHMLVKAGRVREGLALLDESMVVVTTHELWPFVVGIVYCGVILACSDAFEVARARAVDSSADRLEGAAARARCVHGALPRAPS